MRHGRTAWNADGRFQGRSDVPLDPVGRAQARTLARALHDEPFERAIASDLVRATETADIVLAVRADPVACDLEPLWREFDFGAWEGLTWPEIAARFPEAGGRPNSGGRFITPAGGSESFDGLVLRVAAALDKLRALHVASALVVTHAGPLHALLRLACGSDSEALAARFLPASANRFRVTPNAIALVSTNEFAA